ncbi:hypothetical protein SCHPADRAFT_947118 [Schizopora paradoxa]|uniref:Uncharacterized protein n=1 Tax=Schizopora paradoxa TaxID=27342 RepID=A0A0H2RK73_9AGAM|nr:hypothetical protein SCHPADRAFT_947118 [Schizopora paradoxa]
MGWRKPRDDNEELCRQLDYLLDGMQALKTSIEMGRRVDGKGEMKINAKKLWCNALFRESADDDTSVDLTDAKIALRQMKDAKTLLSSVSESLDDAIHAVSKAIDDDCRAAGFSLLPNEVLTRIFELYVDMSFEGEEGAFPMVSPHILASVCRRFRRVTLKHSGLWKHASLDFSRAWLHLVKKRCPNPTIIINGNDEESIYHLERLPFVHPCQQWRELRLSYDNEDVGHLYFEHLASMIQIPLESLECLSITNKSIETEEINGLDLDGEDLIALSSWEMPNLTHLELRNVIPMEPLQCGNVTSFTIHIHDDNKEAMHLAVFAELLQSMPKIKFLSITLDVRATFDYIPDTLVSLPSLKSLELQIDGKTPILTIKQITGLLATERLTSFGLKFLAIHYINDALFQSWIFALFHPNSDPDRMYGDGCAPFMSVTDFSMEVRRFRCSAAAFDSIFEAMPNVQTVSLRLPERANLLFSDTWKKAGVLQRLRVLRLALPQSSPEEFSTQFSILERFFGDGYCKEFERLEVQFRDNSAMPKARLFDVLGEKLRWIEC